MGTQHAYPRQKIRIHRDERQFDLWNDDESEEMKSNNGNECEVESSEWESMSMVEEKDARTKKSSEDLNEFSLWMDDKKIMKANKTSQVTAKRCSST
jgi:hypothetical protein